MDPTVELLGTLPGVGLPPLPVGGLLLTPVARRGPLGGPLLPLLLPLRLRPRPPLRLFLSPLLLLDLRPGTYQSVRTAAH